MPQKQILNNKNVTNKNNKAIYMSQSLSPNMPNAKSRRPLLFLIAAFLLPVILAKLALNEHWFNYGVTNKGDLVNNEITLEKMGLSHLNEVGNDEKKWLLLYLTPKACERLCQQTLHSINNTYIALGKEAERVKPVVLTLSNLTTTQAAQLNPKYWQVQKSTDKAQELFPQSQVLIVDTLGNVILSHKPPQQSSALSTFGKAVLADFKKLLKYSKIG